jgi:biotin carboxyl carrier protein
MTSDGADTRIAPVGDDLGWRPLEPREADAGDDRDFVLVIGEAGVEEDPARGEPAAAAHGESIGLPMRLVVSPAPGRLRLLPAAQFHDGHEWVSAGQAVAEVTNGPEVHAVLAPHDARVAGVMVREGEPVAQGQPLLWLDETARRPTEPGSKGEGT